MHMRPTLSLPSTTANTALLPHQQPRGCDRLLFSARRRPVSTLRAAVSSRPRSRAFGDLTRGGNTLPRRPYALATPPHPANSRQGPLISLQHELPALAFALHRRCPDVRREAM